MSDQSVGSNHDPSFPGLSVTQRRGNDHMREVRLVAWVLLWSCIILALSNTDADASSCFGLESKSVRYAADRHIEVDTLWSLPFPTSATIAAKAWMNGKPLCLNWYERRLKPIREASGIQFDLHEMRDTYASLLIATDKITPEQLTLWLGHSSVTLTLRRYARLFEQRKAVIADAADELVDSLG